MPVSINPAYGSFVYDSNDVAVETWDDEPGFGPVIVPIPRSDRGRDADGYLRPRQVQVAGVIGNESWTSQDELRAAVDAFRWAHRPGRRHLYRDSDRYLKHAQVERLRIQDEGLLWVRYDLGFVAADPYFYSTAADTNTWTGPVNGNTRTLSNQGAATAVPVFTITVNATGMLTLTLANNTTGKSLGIAALAVTSGDELVIDCDAETCMLEGGNQMNHFAGEFFALDPGNNQLQLTLSGVTLASIATTWVKRWL